MNLTHTDAAGLRVITVAESRIDAAIAIAFKDKMRSLTDEAPSRVIVDMSHVDFVDSSGLGAIVACLKQVPNGTNLELASLTNTVAKVMRLTRMDSVFTIHASVEAATGIDIANAS